MNRRCIYYVEGECERQLINSLKEQPSMIVPGKVKVYNYCHEIGVETEVIPKLGSSDDFSYISEKVPGFFALLGAGGPDEGYEYPQAGSITITERTK